MITYNAKVKHYLNGLHFSFDAKLGRYYFDKDYWFIRKIICKYLSMVTISNQNYLPYARHYKARLVCFIPHFSLRFIIKNSKYYKKFIHWTRKFFNKIHGL